MNADAMDRSEGQTRRYGGPENMWGYRRGGTPTLRIDDESKRDTELQRPNDGLYGQADEASKE